MVLAAMVAHARSYPVKSLRRRRELDVQSGEKCAQSSRGRSVALRSRKSLVISRPGGASVASVLPWLGLGLGLGLRLGLGG